MGSPVPSMIQGIGVSSSPNLGGNNVGVPGGSAYGKLIQSILGRNYKLAATNDVGGEQFVIVQLHIARDGRILSVVNGRVTPNHFKKRSANTLINNAVERAVIATVMDRAGGNQTQAADMLGMNRNTLRAKLNKYDIR